MISPANSDGDKGELVESVAFAGTDRDSLVRALERQVAAYTEGGLHLQRLLSAGFTDGRLYLTRVVVAGQPPKDLGAEAALRVLSQVAEALGQLHAHGAVHGGLGADTVLVEGEGEALTARLCAPALADLVATVNDPLARASLDRRARYLAPEVIRGRRPDARADLYALGVLAHELVLGAPPFVAERADDVLALHLAEAPPRPSQRLRGAPRDLDHLLGALLAKDPAQRIEARVAQQLFALLALEPPPPRSRLARIWDALRRRATG